MATLKFDLQTAQEYGFPPFCAACGERTDTLIAKTFAWIPPEILMSGGAWLGFMTSRRVRLSVPFCENHRNHWSWRNRLIAGSVAIIAGVIALSVILSSVLDNREGPVANQIVWMVSVFGTILIHWLLAAVIIYHTSIRATEITDLTITLTRLSGPFVAAIEAEDDGIGLLARHHSQRR